MPREARCEMRGAVCATRTMCPVRATYAVRPVREGRAVRAVRDSVYNVRRANGAARNAA